MSNMYASPRVLVLQQKRMPPELEEELVRYGGVAPAPEDHPRNLDLRPYAGERCRSGWCTSEMALTLLMTEGGGHMVELDVGRVVSGLTVNTAVVGSSSSLSPWTTPAPSLEW